LVKLDYEILNDLRSWYLIQFGIVHPAKRYAIQADKGRFHDSSNAVLDGQRDWAATGQARGHDRRNVVDRYGDLHSPCSIATVDVRIKIELGSAGFSGLVLLGNGSDR
jgi:hypothetical protein